LVGGSLKLTLLRSDKKSLSSLILLSSLISLTLSSSYILSGSASGLGEGGASGSIEVDFLGLPLGRLTAVSGSSGLSTLDL
jgi:hypothetical protein